MCVYEREREKEREREYVLMRARARVCVYVCVCARVHVCVRACGIIILDKYLICGFRLTLLLFYLFTKDHTNSTQTKKCRAYCFSSTPPNLIQNQGELSNLKKYEYTCSLLMLCLIFFFLMLLLAGFFLACEDFG